MKEQNIKKGLCALRLEKVEKSLNSESQTDYTIKKATFSILDFEVSGNKQLVTQEECEKAMNTLLNKPLLCQYIPSDNNNNENPNDDFGDHGETEIELRTGEEYISTLTHAIGTCVNAYIGTIKDENNNDVEGLLADFILWFDRYPNEIMLIDDFYENGETLYSSCEYYYTSFSINDDGIEMPQDITFSGHTVLGSRSNKVAPSYQSSKLVSFNSKWNKALNSLNSINNQFEENIQNNSFQSGENLDSNKLKQINNIQKEEENTMENIFLNAMKANNQLSFGDVRDSLYGALAKIMTAEEYFNVYIGLYDIYDDFFIYETVEDSNYVAYKVGYSKADDDTITIALDSKEKVQGQYTYVSVNELQELENSKNAKVDLEKSENELKSANAKIEELGGEIKSLNEKLVEKSNNAKVDTDKFNELTNKLVALNSMVDNMKPIVEKYNAEVFEKSLNEAKENYKVKFTSVNALEVFEEESTQELIKESVNSVKEKADEAKYSLNALIVNSIKPVEEKIDEDDILANKPKISINQVTKAEDTKELTDVEDDVLSEYGFDY